MKMYCHKKLRFSTVTTITAIVTLSACSITDPGGAASIKYRLPKTETQLATTIQLRSCNEADFKLQRGRSLCAKVKLTVKNSPSYRNKFYFVNGYELASSKVARDLTITVNENGVLTGINSTNTDKTASIISSALNFASTTIKVAAEGAPDGAPPHCSICSDATENYLKQYAQLKKMITDHRKSILELLSICPGDDKKCDDERSAATSIDDVSKINEKIEQLLIKVNFLAVQAAQVKLDHLTIELTENLDLDKAAKEEQTVTLASKRFKDKGWFKDKFSTEDSEFNESLRAQFGLVYRLHDYTDDLQKRPIENVAALQPSTTKFLNKKAPKVCRLWLFVPNTVNAKLEIMGKGVAVEKQSHLSIVPYSCPMETTNISECTQPGVPIATSMLSSDTLCLDVRFGEKRVVNLSFDDFGRKKQFKWGSTAKADSVMSSLSGYATTAAGIVGAIDSPSEIERKQAEIAILTTKKNYNQLKACEAIIEAGGFTCPTSQ